MNSSKRNAIEKTAQFIRVVLNKDVKPQDPQAVKAEFESYLSFLTALNQDASNADTRPFLLISRDTEDTLPEASAQKLVLASAKEGLNDEFVRVGIEGHRLYFFSHKAKRFVDDYCLAEAVAYTNMDSNALVFEEFNCVGIYTASQERYAALLIEAEQILALE